MPCPRPPLPRRPAGCDAAGPALAAAVTHVVRRLAPPLGAFGHAPPTAPASCAIPGMPSRAHRPSGAIPGMPPRAHPTFHHPLACRRPLPITSPLPLASPPSARRLLPAVGHASLIPERRGPRRSMPPSPSRASAAPLAVADGFPSGVAFGGLGASHAWRVRGKRAPGPAAGVVASEACALGRSCCWPCSGPFAAPRRSTWSPRPRTARAPASPRRAAAAVLRRPARRAPARVGSAGARRALARAGRRGAPCRAR